MNVNQIINMVIRIIMRKAINGGISAMGNRMSRGKSAKADVKPAQPHDPNLRG